MDSLKSFATANAGKMSSHYQKLIDKTRETNYNI